MKLAKENLDINPLDGADAATLRRLWAASRGIAPPKTFTARLMRLALAWDVQAADGLRECAKARREWNRIIKQRDGGGAIKRVGNTPHPSVSTGTRFLKDWGGATHEVLVVEGGVAWNGKNYSSLSAVARAMTGTNRNGPKFFGLREGGKQ